MTGAAVADDRARPGRYSIAPSTGAAGRREAPVRAAPAAGGWTLTSLLVGITAVACLDAANSTALSIASADIMGDMHATADDAAWLNMAYVAAKMTAFPLGAWLGLHTDRGRCLIMASCAVILTTFAGGLATGLGELVLWRGFQGLSGGILLVVGQRLLFEVFPRARQPLVQATFALAAVAMPAALAPALQGWLTETLSWSWVFLVNLPIGLLALALLLGGLDAIPVVRPTAGRLDWVGLALLAVAVTCLVYVLQQGSRWNWFDEPVIVVLSAGGAAALLAFMAWEIRSQGGAPLIDLAVLRDPNFAFGFIASFIAGCALFGSAFLIPAFALSVLGFSEIHAGLLLLPSGALIGLGLFVAAAIMQFRRVAPFKLIPVGILLFMSAMWLQSGATSGSGAPDMAIPLLLRGLGLGPLFIALTLVTLAGLEGRCLAHGIGLFNLGRQFGGLTGVAFLQTYVDRLGALNGSVLATHLALGRPALAERQAAIANRISDHADGIGDASIAAAGVIRHALQTQVATLSFNEAFLALALLFVLAAPVLILVKVALSRRARRSSKG